MERECLQMGVKDANTDGSYTHIHWAFASIDPQTWKPVIKQGKDQWADFKKLKEKRILSIGGWADSTEPGKFNIIRSAILQNRETFANNLAQFAKDEGIDGIDIDWEYPGVSPYIPSTDQMIVRSTIHLVHPMCLVLILVDQLGTRHPG